MQRLPLEEGIEVKRNVTEYTRFDKAHRSSKKANVDKTWTITIDGHSVDSISLLGSAFLPRRPRFCFTGARDISVAASEVHRTLHGATLNSPPFSACLKQYFAFLSREQDL